MYIVTELKWEKNHVSIFPHTVSSLYKDFVNLLLCCCIRKVTASCHSYKLLQFGSCIVRIYELYVGFTLKIWSFDLINNAKIIKNVDVFDTWSKNVSFMRTFFCKHERRRLNTTFKTVYFGCHNVLIVFIQPVLRECELVQKMFTNPCPHLRKKIQFLWCSF